MTAKFPDWMGKYPRKGADWSPGEDTELQVRYGFGHSVAELADHHLREPVAITRRLALLRDRERIDAVKLVRGKLTWQQEQEVAWEALNSIRREFPECCWSPEQLEARGAFRPRQHSKSRLGEALRKFKVGDVYTGGIVESIYNHGGMFMISWIPLADLPPEVAQALQFGGESC